MYYTLDLKVWDRATITPVTNYGVSYDQGTRKYAVSAQGTVPASVLETTDQGYLSNYSSRNNGAWRKIGARTRNSVPLVRYANGLWFICDSTYISRINVSTGSGTVSTVAGVTFTDVAYDSSTERYLFSGSGTVRYTTDFTTFTSVVVGYGSSPITSVLTVGPANRMVVGGESVSNARISTSDNGGTSWTNRTVTGTRVRSLKYLPQLETYVMGNGVGEIFTSSDAITWTKQTATGTGRGIYTVGYSDRLRVAYGIDDFLRVLVSADGVTWTNNGATTMGWVQSTAITTRGASVS